MRAIDERVVERLTEYAARYTGFSPDAILPEAIRRAAGRLADDGERILLRAAHGEGNVVRALYQAVSVGETFFFRHPDQFAFIGRTLVPEWIAARKLRINVWSAGCATGEEAYSLAACLLDLVPKHVELSILATDLLERNLAVAREGVYGAWSRRPSGPMLHPIFEENAGGAGLAGVAGRGGREAAASAASRMRIAPRVRALVRFAQHNLLEAHSAGSFDLILCRNVLVYFSPDSVRKVVGHLVSALAATGALLFGPMDVTEQPAGLAYGAAPELQIYRRQADAQPLKPRVHTTPTRPVEPVRAAARPAPPEPIAIHLRALVSIERGERRTAKAALEELSLRVPDYLPGILERALMHIRQGERAAATQLMRDVLRRTEKMAAEDLVPGPEPLPVEFYRSSAEQFLRSRGGAE
jgi:chemotaxis protein methyltransferase CheR